jgi:hypothetical protein
VEELNDAASLDGSGIEFADQQMRYDDVCRLLHAEVDFVAVAHWMKFVERHGAGVQVLGSALDAFNQDLGDDEQSLTE